jgi:hypothetical protein
MVMDRNSAESPAEPKRYGGSGFDPAFHCIRRRPHPLPGTSWLEEERSDAGVVDGIYDAYFGSGRVEWFRWILPPGAEYMDIDLFGRARLWIDGIELSFQQGRVRLPHPERPNREALLAVSPESGYSGGAVFAAPPVYECGRGCIELGDWSGQGLSSYSGGVRYSKSIMLEKRDGRSYILDLGVVRGTAELSVNGLPAGVRILSPYRFEITELLKSGENRIEITVFNTLAPYFNALSPTPFILDGQCVSGILGPIRVTEISRG